MIYSYSNWELTVQGGEGTSPGEPHRKGKAAMDLPMKAQICAEENPLSNCSADSTTMWEVRRCQKTAANVSKLSPLKMN